MSDSQKLAAIRQAMPVTRAKVFLNTGAAGPLSGVTLEALGRENRAELVEGRADSRGYAQLAAAKIAARERFARLVGAAPAEIALTHHTTDGMNIVVHGLNWQPGDEAVCTALEHPGGFLPLYILRQRRGVTLKMVELSAGDSPDRIVARLEAAISPRTRLVVFSHVAWNTGQRLPLAKIAAMCRRRQVLSLVDGAQAAGAVPLDLPAGGVDFYAIPGQKWLCGPEGTGALYLRRERLSMVWPTFVGYASMQPPNPYDLTGNYMPGKGAHRFEVATINRPTLKAMVANLDWLEETVGWEWIFGRIAHLAGYARRAIGALPGASIITPPGSQAGLLSFTLNGYDPARITVKLAQAGIVARFITEPYCVRISTGFYNSEADIDRLVEELTAVLAAPPDSLPEYVSPW